MRMLHSIDSYKNIIDCQKCVQVGGYAFNWIFSSDSYASWIDLDIIYRQDDWH